MTILDPGCPLVAKPPRTMYSLHSCTHRVRRMCAHSCVHTHTGRSTDLPDMYKAVCVHTHLLFFVFSNKKKVLLHRD